MATSEHPETIEVAVSPEGKVIINYRDIPIGPDGWGHLSFTLPEVMALIQALQQAAVQVYALTQARES